MAKTIKICSTKRVSPTAYDVVYCDPANPGVEYECRATSNTSAGVNMAIKAHIARRKAAGVHYIGQPKPAERTVLA